MQRIRTRRSARNKADDGIDALVRTDDPAQPFIVERAMGQAGVIALLYGNPDVALRWSAAGGGQPEIAV